MLQEQQYNKRGKMRNLIKVLQFFRLVDENKQMSLTNIALMTAIVKIATTEAKSLEDVGLLLIPMLGYAHKKYINKQ